MAEVIKPEPTREVLAGLLAALFYKQYCTKADELRLYDSIELALSDFDIVRHEFVNGRFAADVAEEEGL